MTRIAPPALTRVAVKVCGLTDPAQAEACAKAGADAVGLVFYEKSPRHVTLAAARSIASALPAFVCPVGVFVDAPFGAVMDAAETAHLCAVQLHGMETPEDVLALRREGLIVVKAFFRSRPPYLSEAGRYEGASALLFEGGAGALPGGNGEAWDAADIPRSAAPFILAGGLSPENVAGVVAAARPDAVDVSSGVESSPGAKDIARVARFIAAAHSITLPARRIFP